MGAGVLLSNKDLVRELIRGIREIDSRLSRLEGAQPTHDLVPPL